MHSARKRRHRDTKSSYPAIGIQNHRNIFRLDKAEILFDDPDQLPKLKTEDGTIISVSPQEITDLKIEQDGIIFMMFPNTAGAIKPGSEVTIIFNDFSLEPILAQ